MRPLLITATMLLLAGRAWAVVEVEMPLAQLAADSQTIAVVQVEGLDREKERAILRVERLLKGGEPLDRLAVQLRGDGDGDPLDMLRRIEEGTRLVAFVAESGTDRQQVFAYSGGSWFKLQGALNGNVIAGRFQQGEPNLRRTYHGGVDELVRLLDDFVAGKGKLPELDRSIKPGLGPALNGATDGPPPPASVPDASRIELGEAWQPTGDGSDASPAAPPWRSYAVGALLAISALGLAVMLFRSQPVEPPQP